MADKETKREADGRNYPRGDFAYTPDGPSSWKLRLTSTPGGEPDAKIVGMAVAALGKGFRGNKVEIPAEDLPKVKAKVRAAWRKANSDKDDEEMPAVIKAAADALTLDALGLDMPRLNRTHPNRSPFHGVLTRLDEPSDKAPGGANGHRVIMPREVAEAALPTLLGMAIDVKILPSGDMVDHDRRFKIGAITEAWIEGNDLLVAGHLFAKDFPEEIDHIRTLAARDVLGMSYEIADVEVLNVREPVWTLGSLVFTGAAILERDHAAYKRTQVIAASATEEETDDMKTASGVSAINLTANMDDMMEKMLKMADGMNAMVEAMQRVAGLKDQIDGLCQAMGRLANVQTQGAQYAAASGAVSGAMAASGLTLTDVMGQISALASSVAAMGELLTDKQETQRNLATDGQEAATNGVLKTDQANKGRQADGGPARQTMAAGAEYEQTKGKEEFVAKHQDGGHGNGHFHPDLQAAGFVQGQKYTIAEVDAQLKKSGVTDIYKRATLKNYLVEYRQLA